MDDKLLRRAGLDYHEWAQVREYPNFDAYLATQAPRRILAFSTKGSICYTKVCFQLGDVLLFGPETRGLPAAILYSLPLDQRLFLPMQPHNRSLNLSNAVAIAAFEAWRQLDFMHFVGLPS